MTTLHETPIRIAGCTVYLAATSHGEFARALAALEAKLKEKTL